MSCPDSQGFARFWGKGRAVALCDGLVLVERIPTGVVQLAYIDPPLFPDRTSDSEEDNSQVMRDHVLSLGQVLQHVRRCLSPSGTVFVHSEPQMNGCIRLLLDQIFGRENFRQEFIVPRPTQGRHGPSVVGHDTVFFFSSGPDFTFNPQSRPLAPDQIATTFKSTDEHGPYRYVDLTSPIKRDSMAFEWHGAIPHAGHSWRFTVERMDELLRDGRIDLGSPGAEPRLKQYLKERDGDDVGTVWSDLSLRLSADEGLSFPTQKPEGLVERIVRMGSNEGDVVLDPYCGSEPIESTRSSMQTAIA